MHESDVLVNDSPWQKLDIVQAETLADEQKKEKDKEFSRIKSKIAEQVESKARRDSNGILMRQSIPQTASELVWKIRGLKPGENIIQDALNNNGDPTLNEQEARSTAQTFATLVNNYGEKTIIAQVVNGSGTPAKSATMKAQESKWRIKVDCKVFEEIPENQDKQHQTRKTIREVHAQRVMERAKARISESFVALMGNMTPENAHQLAATENFSGAMIPSSRARGVIGGGSGEVLVGKESSADLRIGNPVISERHAKIIRSMNGEITIIDLNSPNGTYVNEVMVEPSHPAPLHEGDIIRFGNLMGEAVIFKNGSLKRCEQFYDLRNQRLAEVQGSNEYKALYALPKIQSELESVRTEQQKLEAELTLLRNRENLREKVKREVTIDTLPRYLDQDDNPSSITVIMGTEAKGTTDRQIFFEQNDILRGDQQEYLVGRNRSEPGAINLNDDTSVSRQHARIIRQAGRLAVEDLNSANGTFVSGIKITPETRRFLNENEVVMFGTHAFSQIDGHLIPSDKRADVPEATKQEAMGEDEAQMVIERVQELLPQYRLRQVKQEIDQASRINPWSTINSIKQKFNSWFANTI